ncbi:MAG: ATP-binding cassette domain-containing protein [Bacteroidales bacterium]|nr:ATP-binding cassette domain-containing protein [Bacteroidales bacterium]MCF8336995.1 ATP-binding cassette domain-containing protein [Bacteroidales bacterium]
MIEARVVTKQFEGTDVIKDISAKFERGITNLIIGQSGSGKTVLMKCLVGLHEVDEGSVYFEDNNFTYMTRDQRKDLRKQMGMLFQGGALFDSLNVEQNVRFPLDLYWESPYKEKLERVNFCLEKVDLAGVNDKMPGELSGGMVKRVAIARAIALNPKFLFCDEPTSGLDPKTAKRIDKLIYDLTCEFNMTTIMNSHDMNSVLEIGYNIAFIYRGKLWWTGTKDEILESDNKELNDFIYTNEMIKRFKKKK